MWIIYNVHFAFTRLRMVRVNLHMGDLRGGEGRGVKRLIGARKSSCFVTFFVSTF